MMAQFGVLQVDRASGQLRGRLQGTAGDTPLAAVRSAAPVNVEVVDTTAYDIEAMGVPATAALGMPFSFQVAWVAVGPTADPFPASPIAVTVEGVSFPYQPDPQTHQATVTVTPEIAGPLQIRVGEDSYIVEVA